MAKIVFGDKALIEANRQYQRDLENQPAEKETEEGWEKRRQEIIRNCYPKEVYEGDAEGYLTEDDFSSSCPVLDAYCEHFTELGLADQEQNEVEQMFENPVAVRYKRVKYPRNRNETYYKKKREYLSRVRNPGEPERLGITLERVVKKLTRKRRKRKPLTLVDQVRIIFNGRRIRTT